LRGGPATLAAHPRPGRAPAAQARRAEGAVRDGDGAAGRGSPPVATRLNHGAAEANWRRYLCAVRRSALRSVIVPAALLATAAPSLGGQQSCNAPAKDATVQLDLPGAPFEPVIVPD